MVLILALLGCSPATVSNDTATRDTAPPATEAPEIPEMDARKLLIRASLDLRGVRPTLAELDAVDADPTSLDPMIDGFLHDPRFEGRVRDLFSEIWLTRVDDLALGPGALGLDDEATYLRAVGDEALRMVGHIAANDLPYTDLVVGDWTMADETTAAIWPLDYPGGTGWHVARYTDGRPPAGVLSTNGLWWRYESTDANANRGRANAVARILLCNDYLTAEVSFDRDIVLVDDDDVLDAVRTEPACAACHDTLDPLAAYLFGFSWDEDVPSDSSTYHVGRERQWEDALELPPSYYGEPGYALTDLGRQIASDERFVSCAVEQVTSLLLRRDLTDADEDLLASHREAFLAEDVTLRALFRSVVDDPRYRAGPTEAEDAVPLKMATPDLLADQVEDLTGYRMASAGFDMMQNDTVGVRTLAGGADGLTVTRTTTSPNPTIALVQQRLAEGAARYVVERDLVDAPASPTLLQHVDLDDTPATAPAAFDAAIVHLHRRIFGTVVHAGDPQVTELIGLWSDVYAIDADPVEAWSAVVAVLLRDPDFLLY